MYLADLQAQMGQKDAEHTIDQAQKAFTLQSAIAEPIPLYADCAEAPLKLWEGLTYSHRDGSQHSRGVSQYSAIGCARRALSMFGTLQPDAAIPERFRLECVTNRTLAAIRGNEMEEALTGFNAGKHGAKALESKQLQVEIDDAYQTMLKRWPNEKRIQALQRWPETVSKSK